MSSFFGGNFGKKMYLCANFLRVPYLSKVPHRKTGTKKKAPRLGSFFGFHWLICLIFEGMTTFMLVSLS